MAARRWRGDGVGVGWRGRVGAGQGGPGGTEPSVSRPSKVNIPAVTPHRRAAGRQRGNWPRAGWLVTLSEKEPLTLETSTPRPAPGHRPLHPVPAKPERLPLPSPRRTERKGHAEPPTGEGSGGAGRPGPGPASGPRCGRNGLTLESRFDSAIKPGGGHPRGGVNAPDVQSPRGAGWGQDTQGRPSPWVRCSRPFPPGRGPL